MNFIKSLLRGLAALGFKFGLLALALTTALVMVYGNSTALKRALRDSKVYDNLIDTAISTSAKDNTAEDQNIQTLDGPQVKQAAKTAFPPAFLQSSSEQIIDSVYVWLRTGSDKPIFRIDVSQLKLRFAEAAGDNALARARQLPVCSRAQLVQFSNSDIDPFTITCAPPGYDITTLRDKVVTDLANNQDFLKDPIITADSLPKDNRGRSVFDNAKQAPKIYHWLVLGPWIIGGLTLLSALLLLLMHDQKRRGLRSIGMISLGCGIFLLVGTRILAYAFNQVNKPTGQLGKALGNNALQHNLLNAFQSLNKAFSGKLYLFGAIYAAVGVATLLALRFTRPKAKDSIVQHEPDKAASSADAFETIPVNPSQDLHPQESNGEK